MVSTSRTGIPPFGRTCCAAGGPDLGDAAIADSETGLFLGLSPDPVEQDAAPACCGL
ncbi:hypothetical protein [Amycolatopsis sp. NPDC051371]|uniref:hypothetical protein n=1 Tax=Amycolatopsis sp. NPDC051371 TaxID=3155800 RepID=UPI00342F04BF